MIHVIICFRDSSTETVELTGLSKRVNAIGLQPIPGDMFSYKDLSNGDREKIERFFRGPLNDLVVTSRIFRFEDTYPAIYIEVIPNYTASSYLNRTSDAIGIIPK